MTIDAPLAAVVPSGNCTRNLNVRLERHQAIVLRRLRNGLEDCGARLKNGSEVTDNSKVIRWLLEQFAKAEQ